MTRQREYSRPVSAPNGSGGIRVSRTPTLTQPPSSARITARTVNPAMTHCRFSISFRIGSSASGWSSTRVAGCAGTYGCHQTAHALLLGDELRVHPDCTLCGATFHRRGAALVQALQVLPPPYSRASGRGKGRGGGGGDEMSSRNGAAGAMLISTTLQCFYASNSGRGISHHHHPDTRRDTFQDSR
jgi:hypothetical protein